MRNLKTTTTKKGGAHGREKWDEKVKASRNLAQCRSNEPPAAGQRDIKTRTRLRNKRKECNFYSFFLLKGILLTNSLYY